MGRYEDEQEALRERKRRRAAKRRRQRRNALIARTIVFLSLIGLLSAILVMAYKLQTGRRIPLTPESETSSSSGQTDADQSASQSAGAETAQTEETESGDAPEQGPAVDISGVDVDEVPTTKEGVLALAEFYRLQYHYDKALAVIQAFDGYVGDDELTAEISRITEERSNCVPINVATVPHVFFHSLLNDSRGLIVSATCTEDRVKANNKAMATVGEFNAILEDLYRAGYVLISLDDLYTEVDNPDGSKSFAKNTNLLLPPNKKGLIMSEDDLSYYHSYGENGAQGYADRLVIDENGEVKCQYTDTNGNVQIGDYDMVPLIDSFIKKHPDFSYRGARPTVALTGYNGIFGYRTNDYYLQGPEGEDLNAAQKAFLRNHPEYDYEKDCAEATKIAEAMKANGWTFASHTYGHRNATDATPEQLQHDHERWMKTVGQFVGGTNKIIFAFGADIGGVGGYTADNEKFMYFKSQGIDVFCNVDGNFGWTEFGSNYVRTGRIALDGVTMYNAMTPGTPSHETFSYDYEKLGITNIAEFFDADRTEEYCVTE